MAEALEKWSIKLFKSVLPNVYKYVVKINNALIKDLEKMGITGTDVEKYQIIDNPYDDNKAWYIIHMARLAIYASHSTNGVAAIHTEILKNDALKNGMKSIQNVSTTRQMVLPREDGLHLLMKNLLAS